ncbi:uncharacterized protein [Nicotiana tomentosiformis]|uniref:uncharacterized protein n=1 Tax=Nicotiana tomentosiformis TaxID=4098 RepID=UPI00388C9294
MTVPIVGAVQLVIATQSGEGSAMSAEGLKRLDKFTKLFPTRFASMTSEDPQYFLDRCHEGSMTVTQHETRFVDLSHHVVTLIPTERERVRRFIDGLTYGIRIQMARETEDDISSTRVVEIARRIEGSRVQGREAASEKRPSHFGGFSGASSGGRGSFGRGHPIRPVQSALW